PSHAITIGVHGDWGAGKSSVLEMIEAGLEDVPKTVCLKFNGWRFQGFEDAKLAVVEGIVSELRQKKKLTAKAADKLKDLVKRIDWLKVAKKAGGFALTAYTGLPSPDLIESFLGAAKKLIANPKEALSLEKLEAATGAVEGVLKREETEHKNVPDEFAAFRK